LPFEPQAGVGFGSEVVQTFLSAQWQAGMTLYPAVEMLKTM